MSARLYLPCDAGALAVGADEVAGTSRGCRPAAQPRLDIVRTGSRGLYLARADGRGRDGRGPHRLWPGRSGDVGSLLDAGLLEGGAHPLRLGRPEDLPFLKRQTRLTFAPLRHRRSALARRLPCAMVAAGPRARSRVGPAAIVERSSPPACAAAAAPASRPGIKWRTVADAPAEQKYIVCNADEGDSGTFADRMIMEGDPYVLIEGMTIAGFAVGATKGYVYIRSEYPHAIATMQRAIAAARRAAASAQRRRFPARFDIEVRLGAGRLCLRRRDRAARKPRRQARHGARQAAAARASAASSASRRWSTT